MSEGASGLAKMAENGKGLENENFLGNGTKRQKLDKYGKII